MARGSFVGIKTLWPLLIERREGGVLVKRLYIEQLCGKKNEKLVC